MNEEQSNYEAAYAHGFDAAVKQFSGQMNLAEIFANPVALAAELQKFEAHNWTSSEWELFCASLKPFQEQLESENKEAYENGEAAGFDDGESEGHDRAEKDFEIELEKEKEKEYSIGYSAGYKAAEKELSAPINLPPSPKG